MSIEDELDDSLHSDHVDDICLIRKSLFSNLKHPVGIFFPLPSFLTTDTEAAHKVEYEEFEDLIDIVKLDSLSVQDFSFVSLDWINCVIIQVR